MAGSFKQQCPSCEAMVPIKDANLVGKKIDCPKCKYRFVVEDPSAGGDDEEPKKAKAKAGKDKEKDKDKDKETAKSKSAAKRRREEEEEEGGFRPKKKGNNSTLIIGVGLAVVAVALLAVAFVFLNKSDTGGGGGGSGQMAAAPSSSGPASSSPDTPPPAGNPDTPGGATPGGATPVAANAETSNANPGAPGEPGTGNATARPGASATAHLGDPSNLLPNDCDAVMTLKVRDLLDTSVGKVVLQTPGASLSEYFSPRLGIAFSTVEQIVLGASNARQWQFYIIRTSTPFKSDTVKKAMALKPEAAIKGQEVFSSTAANSWLQELMKQNPAAQAQQNALPQRGPLLVRFQDEHTLVFGDAVPMRAFLEAGGKPTFKSQGEAAPADPNAPGGGSPGDEGMRGRMGSMGTGGPPKFSGGRGSVGGGSPDTGGGPEGGEPARSTQNYMTINPPMKAMLDQLESRHPVFSMVIDAKGIVEGISKMPINSIKDAQTALALNAAKGQLSQLGLIGASLQMKEGFLAMAGVEFTNENQAKLAFQQVVVGLHPITDWVFEHVGIDIDTLNDQATDPSEMGGGGPIAGGTAATGFGSPPGGGGMMDPRRMSGGQGPGMSGPGGFPPGAGQGGGMGRRRDRRGQNQGGFAGGGGMGRGDPDVGGGRGGFPGPGGGSPGSFGPGGGIGGTPGEQSPSHTSWVRADMLGKTVMVTCNIYLEAAQHEKMLAYLRPNIVQARGVLDMANSQPRMNELGQRALEMVQNTPGKQFPRGTADRVLPSTRAGRPYPPDQRVSWMRDLLPYLGHQGLYKQIQVEKSWRDTENSAPAATLVPQFLDPRFPTSSWSIGYPGVKTPLAATHFVGIAGIGMDAADYAANDPSKEKQLGIFGYERVTKVSDIADGASNTMMMAETPPTYKRPWLAGGGSTVQGVLERGSVKPFVGAKHNGKSGTLIIMADGSVRFVTENVSDDVFKAMATIKGGETGFNLGQEAPKVEVTGEPAAEASPPK